MKVSAVFDIGKTNKKFFLFSKNHKVVFKQYKRFDPVLDDDGDECEDLPAIEAWMRNQFAEILNNQQYKVRSLNFSSYGASFVHIGHNGKPVAPLYNYLKPIPDHLFKTFYQKYGGQTDLCRVTASPALKFLNSGLQLFWLKNHKPRIFEKIQWSLHLPQYLSYLFTGNPVSDYTSIGCHTTLWDFEKGDYHDWVFEEGIDRVLAPVIKTDAFVVRKIQNHRLKIGVGIHDSSSALLPYIRADRKPFLLISTGTWSIALNSFNNDVLTDEDLANDCLNFMRISGSTVRACRLFLGNEYRTQVEYLHQYFGKQYGYHRDIRFDRKVYLKLKENYVRCFRFEHITLPREQPHETNLEPFETFQQGLHQLVLELVELQLKCINRAIGSTKINTLYIDGGFADNELYTKILADQLPNYKLRCTKSPLGSALGATMVISRHELNKKFLKKKYAMKEINK
jgi:sugar (pentulose or hexulose) kinase